MKLPDYTFDHARLTALNEYAILDTPAEQGFDDIVEVASALCQTPIALVSLVSDDRQWFKARVGISECQTDLNSSVCAHALIVPDVLVIPDLTTDERTKANPLVTGEPHIRFYAGAPLHAADGHVIGSLCVIDVVPRPEGLSPAELSGLQSLGRQVVSQLELRRAIAARDELTILRDNADRQQQLLNNELSHRMKNTLALVQAIAAQTLKGVPDQAPVKSFAERVLALSMAHDLLLHRNWMAADMRELVDTVVCTFGDENRVAVIGPPVTLGSSSILTMSLLLHELTTNALKYGALSSTDGQVEVAWRLEDQAGIPMLLLDWRESGGPPVTEPTRKGFGSRLVKMGLAGTGSSQIDYFPTSFVAAYQAPLAELQT
ncbi:MAG: HWE histidine kinase domain-containing protein [Tardiphaga sp.]